jgi:digeranylgeranylglycerophospholipid reductase
MQPDIDIAVIGGGVAGASAAYSAALRGVRVDIFEEHPAGGYPSHCCGHVGIKGILNAGLKVPSELIENEIYGARIYSPSGRILAIECGHPVTWVLNREELDHYLARLACKAGAIYHYSTRIKGLELPNHSRGTVNLRLQGRTAPISCRIAIDAEGCSSNLARSIGIATRDKGSLLKAVKARALNISDLNQRLVEIYSGRRYSDGFFAWIIPLRDGSAKVGLATRSGSAYQRLIHFMRKHPIAKHKMERARLTDLVFHAIPINGPALRTYDNGLLVVGDAASQVKPTTGGGILFSLICGRLAGVTSAEAVMRNDCSSQFLSRYEKLWRRAIGFDMQMMKWLRKIIFGLTDQDLEKVFKLATRFDIGTALSWLDDIDFQGKALFRAARDPDVAAVLAICLLLSIPSRCKLRIRDETESR